MVLALMEMADKRIHPQGFDHHRRVVTRPTKPKKTKAMSLLVSAGNAFFRDLGNVTGHVLRLWWLGSFAGSLQPADARRALVRPAQPDPQVHLRPQSVRHPVEVDRRVIYGTPDGGMPIAPDLMALGLVRLGTFLFLCVTAVLFKRLEPDSRRCCSGRSGPDDGAHDAGRGSMQQRRRPVQPPVQSEEDDPRFDREPRPATWTGSVLGASPPVAEAPPGRVAGGDRAQTAPASRRCCRSRRGPCGRRRTRASWSAGRCPGCSQHRRNRQHVQSHHRRPGFQVTRSSRSRTAWPRTTGTAGSC